MKNMGMPFFGMGRMKDLREQWGKMTTEEKVAFIDKREKQFAEMMGEDGKPNPAAWVAKLDQKAQDWLSKTQEQKEALIKERIENHCRHHHGGHFGFGGGECFEGHNH